MGDLPDLKQIYREHHDFVWRVVRRLGVPQAGIDDAVQEVFVVLHRRRDTFDARTTVRALLYGVARRVAKRHRERAQQRAHLQVVEQEPVADLAPGPEHSVEVLQMAAVLRQILDTMDESLRMTFVLADLEGLSAPEIAAAQAVKLNTVYSRLRLARQQVKRGVARHHARQEGERVRSSAR